jgi:hypothetical protein
MLIFFSKREIQQMINDNLFSQQSRSNKQYISKDIISNLHIVKIDNFFDEKETLKINDIQKELLSKSKNNNNSDEVGILLSLIDWTYITIYGNSEGISLSTNSKAKSILYTAPRNSLLFFHNHPKNSIFSERDIETFLTADGIMMVSVVCNNGRQFFLIKEKDFDKNFALQYYEMIFNSSNNGNVREFLRTCSKANLKFIYGGEQNDR